MKKLTQSLMFALILPFALVPFAARTVDVSQSAAPAEQRLTAAPVPQPQCGRCGDGYCSATCGETAQSCPRDCGVAY